MTPNNRASGVITPNCGFAGRTNDSKIVFTSEYFFRPVRVMTATELKIPDFLRNRASNLSFNTRHYEILVNYIQEMLLVIKS